MTREGDQHRGFEAITASAVMDGAEPSPIAGMDLRTFESYLARALDGDEMVPPSIRVRVEAMRGEDPDSAKRSREWWTELFWHQALEEQNRAIEGLIADYLDMAARHHEQAELARGRMRDAADHLAAIDRFVSDTNEVLRDKENTGRVDRERAIALLKARGVNVDPNDDDETLVYKLRREKGLALDEIPQWTKEYDHAAEEADYNDRMEAENLRKAQELIDRRKAVREGGYTPDEELRMLRELTNEYKADVQMKAAALEHKVPNDKAQPDERGGYGQAARVEVSGQAQSEVSDFEALTGGLTGTFNTAKELPANPEPQIRRQERTLPTPTSV